MKSVITEFELQFDEKPNGYVLRLNNKDRCVLRICQIPKDLIVKDGFVDVVYKDSIPEFIQKIDWKLLREQKQAVSNLINRTRCTIELEEDDSNALEGIVHLIDALQDYAADEMGLGDKIVFNLPEDDKEEI